MVYDNCCKCVLLQAQLNLFLDIITIHNCYLNKFHKKNAFSLKCPTFFLLEHSLCNFAFPHNLGSNMRLTIALFIVAAIAVLGVSSDDKDKKDIGTVIGIDLGTTYSW